MSETLKPADILASLRKRATAFRDGFPTTTWEARLGGERQECQLKGAGSYEGLPKLRSGALVLETELRFPLEENGRRLDGSSLEVTINSLYPMRLECNGEVVMEDLSRVPVAAGPALVDLSRFVTGEGVVRLRQTVFLPENQLMPWWHQCKLTTASLRQGFEGYDTLAAQLELALGLAEDEEVCREAARLSAEWAETENWEDFEALQKRLQDALAPLREKIEQLTVHLIGHSHIDLNWLWTWRDTKEVIRRDFRSVLALMEEFPELTFSHSQPATYEVMAQEEPELFQRVLRHIREGRWEAISMTWVEQDSNLTSGEAHVRQLLQGVQYTKEALGVTPVVYHAPDTFGHPGNLPQLICSAGARFYYHHRCNPGGNWPAYWWEGQDGSRVLALTTPSYNGSITAGELVKAALQAHRHGYTDGLHFHGIGDHGGGPTRHSLQALRRFHGNPLLPKAHCSSLEKYGNAMLASGREFPTHRGESRTIFEGCYTTHGDAKAYNREGENLLGSAEALAVLAGIDARVILRAAWRKVLFNQFHDILAGSAINEVYEEYAADFGAVRFAAETLIDKAVSRLGSEASPGDLVVANPLATAQRDWVFVPEEAESTPHPGAQPVEGGWGFVAEAGGWEAKVLRRDAPLPPTANALKIVPAYAPYDNREDNMLGDAAREAPYFRIETQHFEIYLRRDCGAMVSFLDKRARRELVSFGLRRQSDYLDTARPDLALGVLQIQEEYPHRMSSWQIHEVHAEKSLVAGAVSEMVESGPLRGVIETRHRYGSSTIIQRSIFHADLPWVDFETRIDWQEPGNDEVGIPNLKVSFCARLDECEAWCEMPYGAVRRPADGQETPHQRWADVGGETYGFALLNQGKYGCDILGPRLRLTLTRSAYDPDTIADLGEHTIRYRFVPHAGSWREAGIPELAAAFNQPLTVRRKQENPSSAALPPIRPSTQGSRNVRLAVLKHAESGDGVILRLCEEMGIDGGVRLGGLPKGWELFATDVVEGERTPLALDETGRCELHFTPWQVRTILAAPQACP